MTVGNFILDRREYILLVWSCIAYIIGAVTMVHRWDLTMVEKEMACASLCVWSMWDQVSMRDCPFLAAPPRPYMGGEVSGSDPNRLQVFANPN
jgi:hypothetical protein